MKKYLVLIIVLFLVIAGFATFVYLWLNNKNTKTYDAIQAVPIDASIIVRVEDFAKFNNVLSQSKVWESIANIELFENISSTIGFVDSLSNANALVKKITRNNTIYLAVNASGGNTSTYILSANIPNDINHSDLFSLSKLLAIGLYKDQEKYFNQTSILNFNKENGSFQTISIAINNGILLISNSPLLIEKSISQLDNNISLLNNQQFIAINKTAGSKVNANIYFNLKYTPLLFRQLLSEKYKKGVNTLSDIAQWIELDLDLTKNKMVMSGLSTIADSTNSFLRLFKKQKPIDNEMLSVIPSETGILIWTGIPNLNLYLDDYRSYLDKKGEIFNYTQNLGRYRNLIGLEVQQLFETIINEEVGVVFVPSVNNNSNDDWYIVSKTKSASATKEQLLKAIEVYSKQTHTETSTTPKVIKFDKEKSVEVYHQPIEGLFSIALGSLYQNINDSYFCFIDNWLVMGESPESLERFVKSNIRNNVLQKNEQFKQFSNELPKKNNYLVYINPKSIDKIAKNLLNINNNLSNSLGNFQGITYQLIGGNNLIFNTLTITTTEEVKSVQNKGGAWETKLDGLPIIKPQIVINHISNDKEIFVQDSEYNIYLINSIGRILWKRKLDEALISDVNQVDIFKNRKLQLAFNTSKKLYIIDRNGRDLTGFPVTYPTPATNPVSVIDYDGRRDYRFFQACSDRKIYVYDSKGKSIKGWLFNKTESVVTDRIGFVRNGGLDYIIVFDSNRPYILNRKGEERIKLKKYFSKAPNSSFALVSDINGKPTISTSDTIGLVRSIYFDGTVADVALQSFTKWHCFLNKDINGDAKPDYIFLDNSTIIAFDSSKEKLFQLKIKEELKPSLQIFDYGKVSKIGVVADKSNKIFLIDSKGSVDEAFPLEGLTLFSITKFNQKNSNYSLIVGSNRGTIINYDLAP